MSPPTSARSHDSGYSSNSGSSRGLPPSSFDGSHLPWKTFRAHVLLPHRIHILDSAPPEKIPSELLSLIETGLQDTSRFEPQKKAFREQVVAGRGFGPSPLFPPNLLPHIDKDGGLARCMIPAFSRDALPDRLKNVGTPLYELSVPRSGLGCGFSSISLDEDETDMIPTYLVPTGTVVDFDSGYISPGTAIFCPFLTFERAHGVKEHRLEAANNQAAIAGAWCCRALQMLFVRAYKGEAMPEMPITFSCSIDNTFAIVNLHWTDESQAYCMSPLCKFDLSNDDHFTKFLVWIDAIGQWGLSHLLPNIKIALQRLRIKEPTPPVTPMSDMNSLSVNTQATPDEQLIRTLKTTFDDIPWRFEDEDCTPVSSSTASWGSPMVTDITFTFPTLGQSEYNGKSMSADAGITPIRRHMMALSGIPPVLSPPTSAQSPGLLLQRRLDHAMEEVKDLQQQVHSLKANLHNSANATQNELCAIKMTLSSVLRKETLTVRNRAVSAGPGFSSNDFASGHTFGTNDSVTDVWETMHRPTTGSSSYQRTRLSINTVSSPIGTAHRSPTTLSPSSSASTSPQSPQSDSDTHTVKTISPISNKANCSERLRSPAPPPIEIIRPSAPRPHESNSITVTIPVTPRLSGEGSPITTSPRTVSSISPSSSNSHSSSNGSSNGGTKIVHHHHYPQPQPHPHSQSESHSHPQQTPKNFHFPSHPFHALHLRTATTARTNRRQDTASIRRFDIHGTQSCTDGSLCRIESRAVGCCDGDGVVGGCESALGE